MALAPMAIEPWRKPAVLEKIRILRGGMGFAGAVSGRACMTLSSWLSFFLSLLSTDEVLIHEKPASNSTTESPKRDMMHLVRNELAELGQDVILPDRAGMRPAISSKTIR